MSCPGCEIHSAIHSVVKKTSARPKDDPIPTSSKRVTVNDVSVSIIDEKGDRTIPTLVGKLDGPDDSSVG